MTDTIPYTHWASFDDKTSAEACGKELSTRFDCLTVIDAPSEDQADWLLRAARPVSLSANWHEDVAEVVEEHGGRYDGGEACLYVPASAGPTESAGQKHRAAAPSVATVTLQNARDGHIAAVAGALSRVGATVWRIEQAFFSRRDTDEEYCETRLMLTYDNAWYPLTCNEEEGGWSLNYINEDGDWAPLELSGTLNPLRSADDVAAWVVKEIRYHVAAPRSEDDEDEAPGGRAYEVWQMVEIALQHLNALEDKPLTETERRLASALRMLCVAVKLAGPDE